MDYNLVEVTVNVLPEDESEDHSHYLQEEGNQGTSCQPNVEVEVPFEDHDEAEDGQEDPDGAGDHHHDRPGEEVQRRHREEGDSEAANEDGDDDKEDGAEDQDHRETDKEAAAPETFGRHQLVPCS